MIAGARAAIRRLASATEPADPEDLAALRLRWRELPEPVRHDAQMLGRRSVGCEGTHGVFPRCNLACAPCYHSRDANRVRIDGRHRGGVGGVLGQAGHLRQQRRLGLAGHGVEVRPTGGPYDG